MFNIVRFFKNIFESKTIELTINEKNIIGRKDNVLKEFHIYDHKKYNSEHHDNNLINFKCIIDDEIFSTSIEILLDKKIKDILDKMEYYIFIERLPSGYIYKIRLTYKNKNKNDIAKLKMYMM